MAKIDKYTAPRQPLQNNVVEGAEIITDIPSAEERLSGVEDWYKNNSSLINKIGLAVLGVALGFFVYTKFWSAPKSKEANDAIFRAQTYFRMDSLNWALKGEGNHMGFEKIASKYGSTPAGNLAKYYAGICYLKLGDYKNAEKFLKDFDGKGTMVGLVAKGALGDALMEQGKTDEAIKSYLAASSDEENILVSPIYMERAAIAYEMKNNTAEAIKLYKDLKQKFPQSQQAQSMDRNLARLGEFNP
jgi:tetratricopeptide (TPR) repeat protein